jgi:predicted molibdopterin-dependent oxidoreductase YjgC
MRGDRRIRGTFTRGERVVFTFDGREIDAFAGETVAVALIAAGVRATRRGPGGAPRGPFCLMGSCQECAVRIEGLKVLACATPVAQGLVVETDRTMG